MPGGSVLLSAVSAGRARQVRLLLDAGMDMEVCDDCGQSALIRSVFIEHAGSREKVLNFLLRRGARVSHVDVVGRNALAWACLYGRDKEVARLLKHADVDLDLNQTDMNGSTALLHAVTSGSAATVKLIVDALTRYALSVDVPNYNGVTPLMQAYKLGHDVCASILKVQGNATAGATYRTSDDFTGAEKWAVKCRDLEAAVGKHRHRSQFPPILSQATANKIKYRENRAIQLRVATPVDSEDEDSTYGSEVSYYTDNSFESIHLSSPVLPSPGLELCSVTSSTKCQASSPCPADDDYEFYSSSPPHNQHPPPHHHQQQHFKPSRDLHLLYRIYEDQKSPSYRPAAMRQQRHLAVAEEMKMNASLESFSTDSLLTSDLMSPRNANAAKKNKKKRSMLWLVVCLLLTTHYSGTSTSMHNHDVYNNILLDVFLMMFITM